ncbi:MAG: L,D-transpeptidase/peptidoglycan binding protein [Lachnospiraceae bacterium]|nr:L,D-transpeptidase/peptidoglycan binding protein [Lachnospiraceae bacterium]
MKRTKRKPNTRNIALLTIILLILGIYLYFVNYYRTHFYRSSTINGINYGNQTVSEVEEHIASDIASYSIHISGRNDVEDVITAQDMDYHYISDGQVKQLKDDQNPFLWPVGLFRSNAVEMDATTTFDADLLRESMKKLLFFNETNNIAPTDAYIDYSEDDGYRIIEETYGSQVKEDVMYDALTDAIAQNETLLNLETIDCYTNPSITKENEAMNAAVKKANKYTQLTITYDFEIATETLDASTLHEWINISDDFEVTIDTDKVAAYVDYLGFHYTTFGIARDFTTHDKKQITVSGGDYGWWINKSKEREALLATIQEGKSVTREPEYYQTAVTHKANDIGDSYVEIDLSKQHLWVFKDGKMVVDSKLVSGNHAKKYDTPKGVYSITYKQTEAPLVGEDYDTLVHFWMPFNGNIGLHDATWRVKFGGNIYKKQGSHGCINLPYAKAKIIYQNVEKGTPVVIY